MALTPTLQKLYLAMLAALAREHMTTYNCHIYGFEPGKSANEVVGTL